MSRIDPMKMTGVRNPGKHVLLDTSNRLRAGSWLQAMLHPHQGRRAYDRLVAITNLVADTENLYPRGVAASYTHAGNVYMSVGEWDATLEVMSALMNFDEDVKRRCEHAMCRLGLKIPIFEGRVVETVLPAQFRWPEATLAPDAARPAQEASSVQDRETLVTFEDLVDMIRECAWVELGTVLRQLLGDERQAAYARLDRLIEQWDTALQEDARKPVCRVQVSTPPVQTSTPIPHKNAVVINFPGVRRTSSSEDSIFDSALPAEPSLTPPSSSSTPDPKLPRLIAAGWVPAFCGRETEEAPTLARPHRPSGPAQPDAVAKMLTELKDVTTLMSLGSSLNDIVRLRKLRS